MASEDEEPWPARCADEEWAERPVSAEDIRNAYRLFLGREAENEEVVAEKVGMPRRRMIAAFVTSPEMVAKLGPIADGQLVEVDLGLLRPLGRDLAEWAAALLPLDDEVVARIAGDGSRLEACGAVLGSAGMAQALGDLADRGDPPGEVLADAVRRSAEVAAKIAQSGLFDVSHYRAQLGAAGDVADPAVHYVAAGERLGLTPSHEFDAVNYRLNNPDLVGYSGSLLLHYIDHGRGEGRSAADAERTRQHHAHVVRSSEHFDEAFYREQLGGEPVDDAAAHYLASGEARGLRPSPSFDPALYADLHPDIDASDVNRLLHYELSGRREGRAFTSAMDDLAYPTENIDPAKATILILLHEATHTGAPILGWNVMRRLARRYNVVAVMRNGGTLEEALRTGATAAVGPLPGAIAGDPRHVVRLARRLVAAYSPLYVVANSVETQLMAVALRHENVPVVALVHEFMTGHRPGNASAFTSSCAAMVFPAELVRQSMWHAFREIGYQTTTVLPQGPSEVPRFGRGAAKRAPVIVAEEAPLPPLEALLEEGERGDPPFTVIGLGTVEMRKGVDLFIAAATALKARHPDLPFRFIWIGGWEYVRHNGVGALLEEQAARSGLGEQIRFFPPVDDLEPIYARADALFLSSRLDPLPNITIDAALREIPILCFRDASGIAELLLADPETADLVAPHLDAGAVADRIARLASDREDHARVARAVGRIGRATFDLDRYVDAIDAHGRRGAAKFAETAREERILLGSGRFDPTIYYGINNPLRAIKGRTPEGIYLDQTRHINFALPPVWGVGLRRPMPGFHPFAYGNEAPDFPRDGSRDAFAHFLEKGSPPGRWLHEVIRPADGMPPAAPAKAKSRRGLRAALGKLFEASAAPEPAPAPLRVAMHGHFHYTDNIGDFMVALAANRSGMDLFLTTSSDESAEVLERATRGYEGGSVTIEVGRNIGRDVAPFVRVLSDHVLGRYDVVGHVHGKRSLHTAHYDQDLGNRWRVFLWQNLLGPDYPSADIILARMAEDPRLGMVFPENDYVIAWEKNLETGPALAARLGLKIKLPPHFDFPVGTMFWARVEALRKLGESGLGEDDYPPEPVPIDGTILHAMERMLPLICEDAGYRIATTYIPHVKR